MPDQNVKGEKQLVQALAASIFAMGQDRDALSQLREKILLFQQGNNPVYRRYCEELGPLDPDKPWYLPVEAFKYASVTTFPHEEAEAYFLSSGTGRGLQSRHYIKSMHLYERTVTTHFASVFGTGPFTIVGHLPGYDQQGEASSLVYMVNHLIKEYGATGSGLFLEDRTFLKRAITHSEVTGTPLILFGAAFGLLDLVENAPIPLPSSALVIETGGMKTYRQSISREALHETLAEGFKLEPSSIVSEYGMCELMSQCYALENGIFVPPPWMTFEILDPSQPEIRLKEGQPGALALFDAANVYSASALLTQDMAIQVGQGFVVLGRIKGAELRGCNFLLE